MPERSPPERGTRAAAIFFLVSGGLALAFNLPVGRWDVVALGLLDLALGAVIYLLPWRRLPRQATLAIVPVALVVVGLFELAGANTQATYVAFFFVCFLVAGLTYAPGASLWLAPLGALLYLAPLRLRGRPAEELLAAAVVIPLCAVVAEVVARTVRALETARALELAHSEALEREVNERRRAEASARRLAAIVESSDDSIVGWGLDGRIRSWNAAAERLYGFTEQEALGQPLSLIVPEADEVHRLIARVQAGERVHAHETTRRTRDGATITVSLSLSPIRDEADQVVGAAAIARDVTLQKRLAEEVRQAQQLEAVGKLAGGLAHEFNNLLTIIGGNAFLIRSGLAEGDPARQDVDELIEASRRAGELTRQMLAIGRRQVLHPTEVDLNRLVRAVEGFLRTSLGDGIKVRSRLREGGTPAYADPGQVEQVLLALAFRARDVMATGGTLTLETDLRAISADAPHHGLRPGSYGLLAVSDTGPALDPVSQQAIFEPFFQTAERGAGLGLGLYLVRGIVEQSGGAISVRSEAGIGSRFEVLLPTS